MKFKTTRKATLNNYNCFAVGYCDLQNLFYCENPAAYTCGVYGWNADIYTFGGVAVVTGYRPFGKSGNYETARKYDKAAEAIARNWNYTYDEKRALLDILIDEFLQELSAA